MRRAIAAVLLAASVGACAVPAVVPSVWPAWEPARELPAPQPMQPGEPGPDGGTILVPASAQIGTGVAYRFSLGHCGLISPVDLDGSFWVPIDGTAASGDPLDLESDPEMINATSGVVAVIGDEARFRTESGAVVRFARHDGEREFAGCD